MPRPPVPAEQRQRVSKACGPCKASKRRCDSQLPCNACTKRGITRGCIYSDPGGRANTSRLSTKPISRAGSEASSQPWQRDPSPQPTPTDGIPEKSPIAPSYSSVHDVSPKYQEPTTPLSVPVLTRSRILFNAKGERVFIGDAASLSFLQFLREILAQYIGPSTFAENQRNEAMLEANIPADTPISAQEDLERKESLLESYFAATNGLLDVYTRSEFAELMAETNSAEDTIPNERTAALYVAIAIGGQSRASNQLDLEYAKKYFQLGQKGAFMNMAEDPSVTLTRCFLLMAFYMLCICRRNAAFMYLGIAAKSAYAIGLHVTEHYASTSGQERDLRSRTWKSLRVMDVVVSTILGRLSATPGMLVEPDTFDSRHQEGYRNREVCQDATYQAITVIDDIFQHLLRKKGIDTATAEKYLQRLNEWSASLPSELRKFSGTAPLQQTDQELLIGNIHVACTYYWAVMLVTRPFLIFMMLRESESNGSSVANDLPGYKEINKLAKVCVSSAIYMARMCYHALEPGSLLNNMAILKALVFSAGLVLGFSMVTRADIRYDVEEAFNAAREVLEKLSRFSPQPEHYYDVLNNFSEAMAKHRHKLATQHRQVHKSLVTEILTIDVNGNDFVQPKQHIQGLRGSSHNQPFYGHQNEVQQFPSPKSGIEDAVHLPGQKSTFGSLHGGKDGHHKFSEQNDPNHTSMLIDQPIHPGDEDMETSWDTFAMQISETFPFDSGFGHLFEDMAGI